MEVNGQGTAPFDQRKAQWPLAYNHLVRMSVVVAIAVGAAGAAAAQGPPRGERGWGMWNNEGPGSQMGMWGNGRWGRSSDGMLDRVEGRLAFLKAELKITDAQSAAWTQLAEAVRTAAKHHNERMKAVLAGEQRSKTLPERVEAQEQFMSIRLEEIKMIKTTVKALYATLSEEQKKEADEMVIPMVGMMGGPWS